MVHPGALLVYVGKQRSFHTRTQASGAGRAPCLLPPASCTWASPAARRLQLGRR